MSVVDCSNSMSLPGLQDQQILYSTNRVNSLPVADSIVTKGKVCHAVPIRSDMSTRDIIG